MQRIAWTDKKKKKEDEEVLKEVSEQRKLDRTIRGKKKTVKTFLGHLMRDKSWRTYSNDWKGQGKKKKEKPTDESQEEKTISQWTDPVNMVKEKHLN